MWFRTLLIVLFTIAGALDIKTVIDQARRAKRFGFNPFNAEVMSSAGAALVQFALAFGTYSFWDV